VVIADDNQDGAKTLAMLINVLGCEAHVVNDGASAVALVERLRPDLVLMDVGMPELDGLEATRRIRAHEWAVGIRIIALTGWGQESDRQRSREAGCDGHLVKPIDLPDLEKILETLSPKDAS
jgi:CheY-like chemotaxis protein